MNFLGIVLMGFEQFETFLNVMRRSLMSRGVQKISKAFLMVLRSFSDIQRCFVTFWCIVLCWDVIGWTHVFWGFLWHLYQIWATLKDSWTFKCVLWNFGVDWAIVMGSKRFIKVLNRFLTFWTVLCHSDTFSWGISNSEGLPYVLKRSLKFWRFTEGFRCFFIGFQWFWNVPEGSDPLCDVQGCSEAFLGFLGCTEQFWNIPESSEVFYDVMGCSKAVWGVFMCSQLFQRCHEECEVFSGVVGMFWHFSEVLMGLKQF